MLPPDGFWALGSRQPGGAKVFVGKIDSLAASSRKARRRSDQGHDLISTDLPIADMGGAARAIGEWENYIWAGVPGRRHLAPCVSLLS